MREAVHLIREAEQDPDYSDGVKISDAEKKTTTKPSLPKKEKPKDGNIGKNNAGGYK